MSLDKFKIEIAEIVKAFRKHVCEEKLPDIPVRWNSRMSSTAGKASVKKVNGKRVSKIELSSKVLTTVERLRNTLCHELCHSAAWLIDGYRGGHGATFKKWARIAEQQLPSHWNLNITRCHSYEIDHKYEWTCQKCGHAFKRQKNTIDTSRHRCKCKGSLKMTKAPREQKPTVKAVVVRKPGMPSHLYSSFAVKFNFK